MFFLDQNHHVQSELCEKSCKFSLVEDSFHMWWKMKTVVGEKEVLGTASRLNFYPADCGVEEAEESEVWHFGELTRSQAEELLSHSANDQGAFMIRFSNKHKKLGKTGSTALCSWQNALNYFIAVLSVKIFSEETGYEYKHFAIKY